MNIRDKIIGLTLKIGLVSARIILIRQLIMDHQNNLYFGVIKMHLISMLYINLNNVQLSKLTLAHYCESNLFLD